MKNNGFTLIELLITIAIIGILASVAITAYVGTTLKAARTEAYSNLKLLYLLEDQRESDKGDYTGNLGECGKDKDNVVAIQAELPRFTPGDDTSFSYCIEEKKNLAGGAQTRCFRASAFGNANTRVEDDIFRIDCNNTRNFS